MDAYASRYKALVEREMIRVAVYDTVTACLIGTSTLPPTLRDVVLKKFLECYDRYDAAVKSKLHFRAKEWRKISTFTRAHSNMPVCSRDSRISSRKSRTVCEVSDPCVLPLRLHVLLQRSL
ncbi:hypothetical protein HPB51_003504 [Rhipicephalus microplus]|uniref:Uncharacterized protein n=1 Tax=Rhipicephalus microplus TaxID=6941 RepID=A0A9J6ELF4_RHIMP|nr:hypothetical protein HPB51_003504 [Rhipicephalus microplus]